MIKKMIIACFYLLLFRNVAISQKPVPAHSALEMDTILQQGPEYQYIRPLTGNWQVVQTNYSNEGGKIVQRDTFKVVRAMLGNFLQEVMQPITPKEKMNFTRTTYLNYNKSNLRWEYVVMDTRYPLMMFETSDMPMTGDSITLHLDAFLIPPFFGDAYIGQMGKERRVITFKNANTYIHRQYWTLPAGKEFLAIEYVFKRQ